MNIEVKDINVRRKFLKSIATGVVGMVVTSVLAKTTKNRYNVMSEHQSYDETLHVSPTKPFVLYI